MSIRTEALGAQVAAFGWDRKRSRRLFWIHFPLFVLHVPLAFAIIGLPGAFLFGYFALRSFRRWRAVAPVFAIHEHGFVDRRGGPALRHRFDALAQYTFIDRDVRLAFPFSFIRLHGVALTAKLRGRHFFVNEHLASIRECVALLQEGIVRQRLPAARDVLNADGILHFGPLRMDRLGLHIGRRTLTWGEFRGLQLVMWRTGRRRREPALRILDIAGAQWEIVARDGLADPAVFVLLCAERRKFDAAPLLDAFCGWSSGDVARAEEVQYPVVMP